MRALCHHYVVELQHFSPNTITAAAVFAVVSVGYLGVMPHWTYGSTSTRVSSSTLLVGTQG